MPKDDTGRYNYQSFLDAVEKELDRDSDQLAKRLSHDPINSSSVSLTEKEFLRYVFRGWVQGFPDHEPAITPQAFRESLLQQLGPEQFVQLSKQLMRPLIIEWARLTGLEVERGEHGFLSVKAQALKEAGRELQLMGAPRQEGMA